MTTAEKAKQAVLERVIVLSKDATISDLYSLTSAIRDMTGEGTKHLDVLGDVLSTLLTNPETKGNKK